ncbi:MAG: sulfite exporter TauE/SafE family protein [Wenzhouxiangellaceae bacterium]|nr:sulfite exporter TauE/SafE family protein [Wenzhouxiangellaceae bacterium]
MEWIALSGIGLAAGVLAGLLGIGGGLVIVPAMTALLVAGGAPVDVAVPTAVATALASMLMTSAASARAHARRGNVDWSVVFRLGSAVAIGAAFGGFLASVLPGVMLARIFAVLAGVIGLRMLLGASARIRPVTPHPRGWWLAGPLIGMLSALIGIGGGSFNVPYLTFNGYATLRAVGIAAACGWPIALGGSLVLLGAGPSETALPGTVGFWYLPGVVLIGLGGIIGAPLGTRLAHRLGSARLARVFGVFLLLVALRMAIQSG